MSVYQRLADFLGGQKLDQWDASFADVERVLGRSLPASASRYPAWWANQSGEGHSQTRGWLSAGWKTSRLDLRHRRVMFERDRASAAAASGKMFDLEALVLQAGLAMEVEGRDQILGAALEQAIARARGTSVAALGGTMPDYHAPDRERP